MENILSVPACDWQKISQTNHNQFLQSMTEVATSEQVVVCSCVFMFYVQN